MDQLPEIPAFDAAVVTNVPIGGGLSSSAALEVATRTSPPSHCSSFVFCGDIVQFSIKMGRNILDVLTELTEQRVSIRHIL